MKELGLYDNEQIKIKMYEVLTSENVSESIENNMSYLLASIPEIESMIGFEHKHPHHPDKVEKRIKFLDNIANQLNELEIEER